jgi:hypothetical protein
MEGGMRMDAAEIGKLEEMSEVERKKYIDKKGGSQQEKMLLSLDSGRVSLYTVKLKDQIELTADCDVVLSHSKQGLQENNKYLFTLVYKEKGLIGSTERRLTLGTDSDSARRDWAFSLMLACKWSQNPESHNVLVGDRTGSGTVSGAGGSKNSGTGARDSLSYINELKRQQHFTQALEVATDK